MLKTPDFIIAGAQKCGTTTLYKALGYHPKVFISTPKELNFFHDVENYQRGIEWYASFFEACPRGSLACESSPEYFHDRDAALRMRDALPDSKIIVLLRNPVDRAYSAYWHTVIYSAETRSFEEALNLEGDRAPGVAGSQNEDGLLSRGNYVEPLTSFLEAFGRSRCLVLISEDYFSDPVGILQSVTEFIGIECDERFIRKASGVVANQGKIPRMRAIQRIFPRLLGYNTLAKRALLRYNTKIGYPPMSVEMRSRLVEHFALSNARLEELLGRELPGWRKCETIEPA